MRIRCPHCQNKAIITHTVHVNDKVTEVYINCLGKDCGARDVMRIYHVATITPPESEQMNSLQEQLAQMPANMRRALFQPYFRELTP